MNNKEILESKDDLPILSKVNCTVKRCTVKTITPNVDIPHALSANKSSSWKPEKQKTGLLALPSMLTSIAQSYIMYMYV